jgi:hypothetical protein
MLVRISCIGVDVCLQLAHRLSIQDPESPWLSHSHIQESQVFTSDWMIRVGSGSAMSSIDSIRQAYQPYVSEGSSESLFH